MTSDALSSNPDPVQTARLWQGDGWTAKVIKNEDDDGWAVSMVCDGQTEPALVAPWTMGRDKKNPKPLDAAAFYTWVKTASEVVRRHEQQLHALLHKSVCVTVDGQRVTVMLDITPDDDNPYAMLSATDPLGVPLAQAKVAAHFKLNERTALSWAHSGYLSPDWGSDIE